MKRLKYIYTLLVAILLGFFSFACSDDDVEQTEGNDSTEVYGGEPITTTVKVCVSAPDVSVDIESATRADNANIEYAQPENGGRFQNIVVVVTDNSDKVYAIHCNKWYDAAPTSTGVKQYEVIFPDLKINTTKGRVYALGNVSTDVYNTISGYSVSGATAMSNYTEINNLIKTSNISVTTANLYKLSFKPQAGNFKVGSTDVTTACSGMPVNAVATATIKKGATVFDVKMRRVCARLQVTFRNFTGQYIDYETNTPKDNNVYVDQFVINRVLATSSKYFYDGSAPSNTGSEPFNILDALGGTNDHVINKIENGKDITISMYVFENKKGTNSTDYQYNLKVDRGKSLGLNTTTIDPENAYVIWNNTKHNSIAYKNGVICASEEQDTKDKIPFNDQVFWKLEDPICSTNLSGEKVCMLRHFQINVENDTHVDNEEIYFKQQSEPDWDLTAPYEDIDGTPTTNEEESQKPITNWFGRVTGYETVHNDIQYVHFKLDDPNAKESKYTMNLLKTHTQTHDYWESIWALIVTFYRYNLLTISDDDKLSKQRSEIQVSSRLGNYDWTLYAKYIIKPNQTLRDKEGPITQIERNHSYELEFKVMPNYDTKQELLVNCVRRQNEIDWSETQK